MERPLTNVIEMNLMSIRQALSRRTTLASCDHTLADLCNVSEKSHRPLGMRSKGYRFSSNSAVVWLYKRLKRVRGTSLPRVFFKFCCYATTRTFSYYNYALKRPPFCVELLGSISFSFSQVGGLWLSYGAEVMSLDDTFKLRNSVSNACMYPY